MLKHRSLGIKDYEIFQSVGAGYSLTFSGRELKTRERSEESGYGVRVLKNKKLGFSYCEKETEIDSAAKRALTLSKFSPSSSFSFTKESKYKKLDIVDKKVKNITSEELMGIVGQVRQGIEKYSKKARIILSAGVEKISIENDNGLHGEYDSTGLSVYCEGMAEDGFGFFMFVPPN